VLGDVASMPRGTGWVWSPEIGFGPERIAFPKFRTYDSFSPSAGAQVKLKGWAEVDLEDVKAKLAQVVQEAEANDPRRLRMTVAALQRELADLRKSAPASALDHHREALERARKEGQQEILPQLYAVGRAMTGIVTALDQARSIYNHAAADAEKVAALPVQRHLPPAPGVEPKVYAKRMPIDIQSGAGDTSLGNSGKRRMLIALAQNPNGLTYTKLSLLTGISQSGGTWRTYLGELRGQGLVDPGEPVRITQAGLKALGTYEPLPIGQALIDYWRSRLGRSGKRAIFDAVLAAYPRGVAQEDVSARTGISMGGGTWRTYLGELRGLELIVGRGELRASEELF